MHIAQGKRSDTLGTCTLPYACALKGQKHNIRQKKQKGHDMLLLFQSAAHTEPLTQGAALGYVHIGLSARLTALAVIMIIPPCTAFHNTPCPSADTNQYAAPARMFALHYLCIRLAAARHFKLA